MAVAAAEPRRKSRRANVVLNFDRKTAADFSGGWSIRLEPLPNRLSANKFPCQTSYERRSQRFLCVGQGWTCAGGNGTERSNVYAGKRERETREAKKEGKIFVSISANNINCYTIRDKDTILTLLFSFNDNFMILSKTSKSFDCIKFKLVIQS